MKAMRKSSRAGRRKGSRLRRFCLYENKRSDKEEKEQIIRSVGWKNGNGREDREKRRGISLQERNADEKNKSVKKIVKGKKQAAEGNGKKNEECKEKWSKGRNQIKKKTEEKEDQEIEADNKKSKLIR